jgi:hypothetical protein
LAQESMEAGFRGVVVSAYGTIGKRFCSRDTKCER